MKTAAVCMLLVVGLGLSACVSSVGLVSNTKASAEVKAKRLQSYQEVMLIPPKEDPRKVVPQVVSAIEGMGLKVRVVDRDKSVEPSQGTGFVVGRGGWLLTCAHVVGAEKEATITLGGKRYIADVRRTDRHADMALLKLREPLPDDTQVLALRLPKPAAMGEDVFTIGYPLSRLLGNNARMSKGLLSATSGLRDDPRQVQVSAEIQPGNSGGPLLDHEGQVIGLINQTINPAAVAQSTGGALPQNINFAIKIDRVADFVRRAEPAAFAEMQLNQVASLDSAAKAVVKVQAGIAMPDSERASKLVVRLDYASSWDGWYRFRLFMLAAFDYDTHEVLFLTGQPRDNLASNEEVVMRDTLAQFKKALASR